MRKVLDSNGDGTTDGSTIFVYDGNQIALQLDKTGTGAAADTDLSHRYLFGTAVDQILADEEVTSLTSEGEVFWPLTDHVGSVRDVIDGDENMELHRAYDAFGNVTSQQGTLVELFGFTGKPFDADTGLQNNLNRWYDAAVGRWLCEDPVGFGAGDGNLYRYVHNRVPMLVDAAGLGEADFGFTESPTVYKATPVDPLKATSGAVVVVPAGEFIVSIRMRYRSEVPHVWGVSPQTDLWLTGVFHPNTKYDGKELKMAVVEKVPKRDLRTYNDEFSGLLTDGGWMVNSARLEVLSSDLPQRAPSIFPGDYFPPYNRASNFTDTYSETKPYAGNSGSPALQDQLSGPWFRHHTWLSMKLYQIGGTIPLPHRQLVTKHFILGVRCEEDKAWLGFVKLGVRETPTKAEHGMNGELLVYHPHAPASAAEYSTRAKHWGAVEMPGEFRDAKALFNARFQTGF